jgi:polar amino acid transport system permease protein
MYSFNLKTLYPYFDELPGAIVVTVELTLVATLLSAVIGIAVALMRRSQSRVLRSIGALYVEIIRNMPLLVLIYLIYFGLPALGLFPSSFVCALIALTLNSGSFMTEIFRAGLIAIPRGQYEAARSQGMTNVQLFRFVVLPQILRACYAPLGNQLIGSPGQPVDRRDHGFLDRFGDCGRGCYRLDDQHRCYYLPLF